MEKHSVQINENGVVHGILTDSLGRVPQGNIELASGVNHEDIFDTKYDSTAESSEIKTATSFVKPSAGKYWAHDGTEQDLPT